jgi:hypothetical protein
MYPILFTSNLEDPVMINSIICMNILPDISTVADALFHHIEDDLTRYRYKEFFQKYVKDTVVPEVIRDGYKKCGVRVMQNIWRTTLLTQGKQG